MTWTHAQIVSAIHGSLVHNVTNAVGHAWLIGARNHRHRLEEIIDNIVDSLLLEAAQPDLLGILWCNAIRKLLDKGLMRLQALGDKVFFRYVDLGLAFVDAAWLLMSGQGTCLDYEFYCDYVMAEYAERMAKIRSGTAERVVELASEEDAESAAAI